MENTQYKPIDVLCKKCDTYNNYNVIYNIKNNKYETYCNECKEFIKRLAEKNVIENIKDINYLLWMIDNQELSEYNKGVINKQIIKIKNEDKITEKACKNCNQDIKNKELRICKECFCELLDLFDTNKMNEKQLSSYYKHLNFYANYEENEIKENKEENIIIEPISFQRLMEEIKKHKNEEEGQEQIIDRVYL